MIASARFTGEVADLGQSDFCRTGKRFRRAVPVSGYVVGEVVGGVLQLAAPPSARRDRRADDHQDHQHQHRRDQIADHVGVRRGSDSEARGRIGGAGIRSTGVRNGRRSGRGLLGRPQPTPPRQQQHEQQATDHHAEHDQREAPGRPPDRARARAATTPAGARLGRRSRIRAMIANPMIATAALSITTTTASAAGLVGGFSRSATRSPPGMYPRSAQAATVMQRDHHDHALCRPVDTGHRPHQLGYPILARGSPRRRFLGVASRSVAIDRISVSLAE